MPTLGRVRRRDGRRMPVLLAGVMACAGALVATPVASAPPTAFFVPVGPIRLADTRIADCGCTRVDASTIGVAVTGRPGVPDGAIAASVTVTALRTDAPGHVTVWPSGAARPGVSTLNTRPDRVVANSTIVRLGSAGRLDVFNLRGGDVVVDLTGVFLPADHAVAGRFVPLTPRRLVDTRTPDAPSGAIPPGGSLTVPLPPGVDVDATALVVNVTSVRERQPGHLSARPAGSARTRTSFMNVDGSGLATAASTIIPVSTDGFVIESSGGGHLVVDVVGWFTGPSARDGTDGLFVPIQPLRMLDTRAKPPRANAGGTVEIPSPFPGASAIATNVTVVRPDWPGHVTAFPARTAVPTTSTVNPVRWNHTVANFAITRLSTAGTAYRSHGGADLVVDATGWFTGTPAEPATGPPTNPHRPLRVLLVGDSTLASVPIIPESVRALGPVEVVVDAASCRRLLRPSCRSDTTGLIPNTAVEAIRDAPGSFDVVVMKTGYNDWFSDFPAEFDAVVQMSRAKGARTVLWLTYNEAVPRPTAQRAYRENNVDLRWLTTLPQYADVLLADWFRYSTSRPEWFYDGTHLTPDGTWALTDFVGRWLAAIEHRPCQRPWAIDASVPSPCPPPEQVGPVADPRRLY